MLTLSAPRHPPDSRLPPSRGSRTRRHCLRCGYRATRSAAVRPALQPRVPCARGWKPASDRRISWCSPHKRPSGRSGTGYGSGQGSTSTRSWSPQAGRAGAGQCGRRCRPSGSPGFGGLRFRPRAWVPGDSAGKVITSPDWSRAGRLRRPGPSSSAERYSRKVQQPAWIPGDAWGRRGTVTCTDGRRWTSCRWMACKRSGVRIPVAPQLTGINSKF
jgi:hypothetical protein